MRLTRLHCLRTLAATGVAAAICLAAAPAVPATVLLVDEVDDTSGLTNSIDTDGRVDITELSYERDGTVSTFTVGLVDPSDEQFEDVLGSEPRGWVVFIVDDCSYWIAIDGGVDESCNEVRRIGTADVELDSSGYRLTVDLAALDAKAVNHLKPGVEATAPYAMITRGHLNWTDLLPSPTPAGGSRSGIGLGGCSFCGGQSDIAYDEYAYWDL